MALGKAELDEIGSALPRLYEAVGWGEGKTPDWAAFRACLHPKAMLVPMGSGAAAPLPVEDFIAGMEEQRTSGAVQTLREIELGRKVEVYANLASVRSTFLASIDGGDRRGVTFAHLVRDNGRWVILSAAWENERDDEELPAEFI